MARLILLFVAVYHVFILQTMSQDVISLDPLASGFSQPVDIVSSGDEFLYIVEQRGRIRVMDTTGTVSSSLFLDIRSKVTGRGGELGLLGLAFHPSYPDSPYCYVNYSRLDESTVIERYLVVSPQEAAVDSNQVILVQSQPFSNHNAGDLAFGPDGYLYVGMGDGGSGDDPERFGQNRQSLLGKMLRIDIDVEDAPYGVPADNPFVNDDETLDEIWSIGLRNPWRYSFDRETGSLFIADVGQRQREEVNVQAATSPGGENYGWRCFEGSLPYLQDDCPAAEDLTLPTYEYAHQGSNCSGSITGGFVYRGKTYDDLNGIYIMADYCTGVFRGWNTVDSSSQILYEGDRFEYSTFGEDASGELYVAAISGEIFRIRSTTTSTSSPGKLAQITLYPNPSRDRVFLNIENNPEQVQDVRVYNTLGMCVLKTRHSGTNGIDVSGMTAGLYYVVVSSGGTESLGSIIVSGNN